ncbi:MAG: hypothetical protein A2X11_01140 [Bacteroidetes bacterium GWE2_42_24]|nr:MAG: hypothetical protein A2X11_01140 [Bacteroidetes bacterium GWE2_42_24]OFY27303.1 MAG: hypothetical protein A2X09_00350 [Bacteroidetes bacterium GWF2_43_11]
MKRFVIYISVLLILPFSIGRTIAQPAGLTLDSCYKAARIVFPGIAQLSALAEMHRLALENIRVTYLPKSTFTASASYQSDVTSIDINLPMVSIPKMSKDSYKAYLDVNQLIYDGGATKARREGQLIQHEVDNLQVESDFYKVKELVNDLFFSVLMGSKMQEQLELGLSNLKARRHIAVSAVENGVLVSAQLELIDVEIITQQQRLVDVEHAIDGALQMLSVWIGQPLSRESRLEVSSPPVSTGIRQNLRPEQALFGLQQKRLEEMSNQTDARTLPVISGYGQAGYGRPGLNMLLNEFDSWYLVGLRFQWNFWDWKQTTRDRTQLRLQEDIISAQKKAYDQRTQAQIVAVETDITRIGELLKLDGQIILSREKIRLTAVSQFDNGALEASDLVARTNEETQARINYEIHKLQLIQNQIKYLTILGQQ